MREDFHAEHGFLPEDLPGLSSPPTDTDPYAPSAPPLPAARDVQTSVPINQGRKARPETGAWMLVGASTSGPHGYHDPKTPSGPLSPVGGAAGPWHVPSMITVGAPIRGLGFVDFAPTPVSPTICEAKTAEWMRMLHSGLGIPRRFPMRPITYSPGGQPHLPRALYAPVQPWQCPEEWKVGAVKSPWGNLTPSTPRPGVTYDWLFDVRGLGLVKPDDFMYGKESYYHWRLTNNTQDVFRFTHHDSKPMLVPNVDEDVPPLIGHQSLAPWVVNRNLAAEMRRPGRSLGHGPVFIYIPIFFLMATAEMHDDYKACMPCTLIDDVPCAWSAQMPGDSAPQLYTWPWLWFWKRQVRFWTAEADQRPDKVVIGSDGIVAVNRTRYIYLAKIHEEKWKFQGHFIGGHCNWRHMEPEWDGPETEEDELFFF